MLTSGCTLLLAGLAVAAVSAPAGAENAITLQHNPFNKPQILAAPPPQKVARKKVSRTEESRAADVLPILRAVLISASVPMVIADDEMLSPGEEINGYRLLSVGKRGAIFEKLGKQYTILLEDDEAQ